MDKNLRSDIFCPNFDKTSGGYLGHLKAFFGATKGIDGCPLMGSWGFRGKNQILRTSFNIYHILAQKKIQPKLCLISRGQKSIKINDTLVCLFVFCKTQYHNNHNIICAAHLPYDQSSIWCILRKIGHINTIKYCKTSVSLHIQFMHMHLWCETNYQINWLHVLLMLMVSEDWDITTVKNKIWHNCDILNIHNTQHCWFFCKTKVIVKPEFEAVSKYLFYLSSFFEHPQFLHFLKNKTVVSVISCLRWTMPPRQN